MEYPLPDVPGKEVPCDLCGNFFQVQNNQLPLDCPHCGRRLRPEWDSIWSHFTFTIRHRLFTWQGRATRKEFWSYIIISSFFACLTSLTLLFFYIHVLDFFLSSAGFLLFMALQLLIVLMVIVPGVFLTARRLHDFGVSGKWSALSFALDSLQMVFFSIPIAFAYIEFSTLVTDAIWFDERTCIVSDEYMISCDSEYLHPYSDERIEESVDALFNSDLVDAASFIGTALFVLSGIGACLNFFLLIAAFIDSDKGTNKYGFSRKYFSFS